MNTSRAGSNRPCSRIQRRRARATSARFCSAAYRVFFTADVAASEEPPHRAAAASDPTFAHRRDDLVQRKVRLVGNQTQQKLRVLLQRRGAAAAWLCCNAAVSMAALQDELYEKFGFNWGRSIYVSAREQFYPAEWRGSQRQIPTAIGFKCMAAAFHVAEHCLDSRPSMTKLSCRVI